MNFQPQGPGVKSYLHTAGLTRWHVTEGCFCWEHTELGGHDPALWFANPEMFRI